ncbi:MAG TPA: hypothetical protein PLD88_00220, partial [Candidatus Berkiella sp.]|nr:hypothetical protein [Candidatus Berkiella sp.]
LIQLKQYAGLSYSSVSALLMHLIPLSTFFARFTRYYQEGTQNRYDQYLSLQNTFYTQLIKSILDQSLPLLALQDYFNKNAHDTEKLEQLSCMWDEQDRTVFKPMLKHASLESFVDALDEFISLREALFNTTFQLPPDVSADSLESIQMAYSLEDQNGQWHSIDCQPKVTRPDTLSIHANVMQAQARYREEANFRELRRK